MYPRSELQDPDAVRAGAGGARVLLGLDVRAGHRREAERLARPLSCRPATGELSRTFALTTIGCSRPRALRLVTSGSRLAINLDQEGKLRRRRRR